MSFGWANKRSRYCFIVMISLVNVAAAQNATIHLNYSDNLWSMWKVKYVNMANILYLFCSFVVVSYFVEGIVSHDLRLWHHISCGGFKAFRLITYQSTPVFEWKDRSWETALVYFKVNLLISSRSSVTMTTKRGLITDSFKVVKEAKRVGKREKRPRPSPPRGEGSLSVFTFMFKP